MRELLGGKGARVAEMTHVLGQEEVPPGLTITTAACVEYVQLGHDPDDLTAVADATVERLEQASGGEADPNLRLGLCGEHAGDPHSIAFFTPPGDAYISCSPPRIPVAEIAAAQAAIAGK